MALVPASKRVGTRIAGKYQLVRVIGEGGMGAVYEARHVQLNRRMAVKMLRAEHQKDRAAVERFLREARVAAAIGHPSIVEIFDYGEAEDGTPFIVMAYLEGETLADRLYRMGRLDEEAAALALLPVMGALDRAHQRGIIHRDLKPENIVLARNAEGTERPILVDFGVSKNRTELDTNTTIAGTVLGTPAYMAPEQARGRTDIDERADVYAMGAVLYELLTGVCPFQRENYTATLAAILSDPLRPPTTIVPTISPAIESVVMCAMSHDPAKRFRTMGEMRRMLADAIDAPITATVPAATQNMPQAIRPAAQRPPGAAFADDRTKTVMLHVPPPSEAAPGRGSRRRRWQFALGVVGAALLCAVGVGLLAYVLLTGATPSRARPGPAAATAVAARVAAAAAAPVVAAPPAPAPVVAAAPPVVRANRERPRGRARHRAPRGLAPMPADLR